MSIESRFPDREALERVIEMRMEEGMTEALGQIDGLLAKAPAAKHPSKMACFESNCWGKNWGKKPHGLQPIPADLDHAKPA